MAKPMLLRWRTVGLVTYVEFGSWCPHSNSPFWTIYWPHCGCCGEDVKTAEATGEE